MMDVLYTIQRQWSEVGLGMETAQYERDSDYNINTSEIVPHRQLLFKEG